MGGHCCKNNASPDVTDLLSQAMRPDEMSDHVTKLVYVDRVCNRAGGSHIGSDDSTVSSARAKTLRLVQASGTSAIAIYAKSLDTAKVQEFRDCLEKYGVDTTTWGRGGLKSLEHLYWETFSQRAGIVCLRDGKPQRIMRILKVKLVADIYGVEHELQSRLQFLHDGQCIERKQVVVRRLVWGDSHSATPGTLPDFDASFQEEECKSCEPWRTGLKTALKDRLGLSAVFQDKHLEEEMHSHQFHVDDKVNSGSFPGLLTLYCVHDISIRVVNAETAAVHCLGLPTGQEFATTEGDFNLSQMQSDEEGMPLGSQLNIWTWVRSAPASPASPKAKSAPSAGAKAAGTPQPQQILIKRVPIHNESIRYMAQIQTSLLMVRNKVQKQGPCTVLSVAQGSRKTDWAKAKMMAHRIADPTYSLKQFTDDLQAFPELDLYLLDSEDLAASNSGVQVQVSGRTLGDEFQRTIGAFFAIYWLMRLDSDGKAGFSFGVDKDWKAIDKNKPELMFPAEKRLKFYEESSWSNFEQLLVDSEMLEKRDNKLVVNEDRVLTMLALTAVHDIMKVQSLLPTVQPEHAPYHGYTAGDTISDHDHALSYLMDHYPTLLPSYHGLNDKEKLSVAFTQCQLQFNQGWFVQAEAPPGAIFTKFKEVMIRDKKSRVMPRDIALYFVHWLTDLAGAEPTPLGGCEKFVVKFPLPVLNSFLRSFPIVKQLAHKSETEVMEDYLKMRWLEHQPSLGPIPKGKDCIAKMRLICMAQMNAGRIIEGFDKLTPEDQRILAVEMARTGCIGQSYSRDLTPPEVQDNPEGPGLLIYYGPAFLQALGHDDPVQRLRVLAEVYRSARELWPLSVGRVGQSVTIRIDTIKGLSVKEVVDVMRQSKVWVMVKHNELEAFIELSSTSKLNKYIANHQSLHVLELETVVDKCSL